MAKSETETETEQTEARVLADCKLDMNDLVRLGMSLDHADQRVILMEGVPCAVLPNGVQHKVLMDVLAVADDRAPAPRRRKGTANHQEIDSFIAHVNRFKDPDSVVWADNVRTTLTAILDYHEALSYPDGAVPVRDGSPRWGGHRSVYTCPLSDAWKRWSAAADKPMPQDAFGDFIEANMADLAAPAANEVDLPAPNAVLQMARSLIIRRKGTFERTLDPTTGASTLVNKVDNEPAGTTKIPRAFLLALPVFEAGTVYRVEARIRMSLSDEKASFTFSLYQAEVIKRDAFGEVRDRVKAETKLPVYAGAPEVG